MMHETTAAASFDLAAFAPPDYGGEALQKLNALNRDLAEMFRESGFAPIEPAILQPADILFDLYGEEIWERSFIIEDVEHGAWCLRPDFTAPVARSYLRDFEAGAPARFGYSGPVFRRARGAGDGALQQMQAGVEIIGEQDPVESDAAVFDLARRALERAGCARYRATIGDLGLFFGLLQGASMPDRWRARLRRHFRRPELFGALLRRYAGQLEGSGEAIKRARAQMALVKSVGAMERPKALAAVREMLDRAETPQIGLRDEDEAIARFLAIAADAQAHPLSDDTLMLLEAAAKVKGPATEIAAAFGALAADAGVDLSIQIGQFERRLEALAATGVEPAGLYFDAVFGRDLAYYNGFVFEMRPEAAPGAPPPRALCGGGRYDRLFQALGAPAPVRGVGAAMKLEPILAEVARQNGGPAFGAKGATS